MSFTIFGRNPVLISSAIETILALAMSFGLFGLNQDVIGVVMAVVMAGFGVYNAWRTNATILSSLLGFCKAAFALIAVFGLTLTDAQTGALLALVSAAVGILQNSQVVTLKTPSFERISRAEADTI